MIGAQPMDTWQHRQRIRFATANAMLEDGEVTLAMVERQAMLLAAEPKARADDVIADRDSDGDAHHCAASNALRQYDLAFTTAERAIAHGGFELGVPLILALHRAGAIGLSAEAGNLRRVGSPVAGRSRPPGAMIVPELLHDMCEYVNGCWGAAAPNHLAAYALGQMEWIRPFRVMNDATARVLSFLLLAVRTGSLASGRVTIAERVLMDRTDFESAFHAAATSVLGGQPDVTMIEHLLATSSA